MRMNLVVMASAAALTLGTAAAAAPNIRAVMHERHEGMETIGKAFKSLRREFDASSPNPANVKASANQIASLAKRSSGWFPRGSGPEAGKTGAKPEIWRNWNDFVAKDKAFQQSARMFQAAAASGNMNAAKARFGELGQTCKACHDKYRSDMHH